MQLLQQQFFDMRMKLDAEVVDHVGCIEQLASQPNNLGEPIWDQAVIRTSWVLHPTNFATHF